MNKILDANPVPSVANPIVEKELEMDRYLMAPKIGRHADPLDYWRSRQVEFPHLAQLARKFLATPCSSVYSERVFSELGNIYSDERSRLSPEKAEQLLFLHHNLPRMSK